MSAYEENLCTLKDILFCLPEAGKYHQRSVLSPNWIASSTTSLYYLYGANYATSTAVLFKDGKDLGTEQGSQPSSDNTWRFVEADNRLEYFLASSSASVLNGSIWELGEDADTYMSSVIIPRASSMIRGMANQPLYPQRGIGIQSGTTNNFPEPVVLATAYLSASYMVGESDAELSQALYDKVTNTEDTGIMDKLRSGEITLYSHQDIAKAKGVVTRQSVNASTTGDIVDVRGKCSIEYDLISVKVSTSGSSGTLTAGTDNTNITYTCKGWSSSGLQTATLISDKIITGGYDDVGRGSLEVRFSYGTYYNNDTFWLEVTGEIENTASSIKIVEAQRV